MELLLIYTGVNETGIGPRISFNYIIMVVSQIVIAALQCVDSGLKLRIVVFDEVVYFVGLSQCCLPVVIVKSQIALGFILTLLPPV